VGGVIRGIKEGIDMGNKSTRLDLMAFLLGFLSLLVALFFGNLYKPWLFVWAYTGLMMRVAVEASRQRIPISIQGNTHNVRGTASDLDR